MKTFRIVPVKTLAMKRRVERFLKQNCKGTFVPIKSRQKATSESGKANEYTGRLLLSLLVGFALGTI